MSECDFTYTGKVIDIDTNTVSDDCQVEGVITDVAEKYGVFYLAVTENSDTKIISFDGQTFVTLYIFENAYDSVYAPGNTPTLTVSEDNSIYITHPVENHVYKVKKSQDAYTAEEVPCFVADQIDKMQTDLFGELFCLSENSVLFLNQTTLYSAETGLSDIKSFAIDENQKAVYFVREGFEGLIFTEDLPNFAMQSIFVDSFVTDGTSADITTYKTYKVTAERLFAVVPETDGIEATFNITGSYPASMSEYLCICASSVSETLGEFEKTVEFNILAGQTQNNINLFFVAKSNTLVETTTVVSADQQTAFVISDVNMYYLPIISIEDTYALKTDVGTLRLKKGDAIKPISKTTFLGKEFFFASISAGNNEIYGFVPVNFTVEILNEDVVMKTYTLEKVKGVTVVDENGNQKITLEAGTVVRLYTVANKSALIEYLDEGIWKHGYIDASAIIKAQNTVIRNAVVIILMTASVVATSIYFIIRKKHG